MSGGCDLQGGSAVTHPPVVWGVHMPEEIGARAVEQGYVAIGWPELGDPRGHQDRDALKRAITATYPNAKPGSWPVSAGVLWRFVSEMQAGDLVVYPSKHDRMVNLGRFVGGLVRADQPGEEYPNRRRVEWLRHFARNEFSQAALHEIGAFISVFLVKRHAVEFIEKAGMASAGASRVTGGESLLEEEPDDDAATVAVSKQAETTTGDFIIRQIMEKLTGREFEKLVAHLLECMGYTARVTPESGDGGVDVIAHRDRLGFEPPIVKVQCKRTLGQIGRPDVDRLLGTLGEGEYGLFVTLGGFSREAVVLERNKSKLRLIDGEQFVELVTQYYSQLAPRYRSLIPLKQIHVPDLEP